MSTRDEYVEAIKQAAFNIAKKQVMNLVAARVPFLAGGIFGIITSFIVGQVLKAAIRETELGLFFLYIDLRTNQQGRDFEAAAYANRIAQTSGTPEEKARAEKELIDRARVFFDFKQ